MGIVLSLGSIGEIIKYSTDHITTKPDGTITEYKGNIMLSYFAIIGVIITYYFYCISFQSSMLISNANSKHK